MHKPQCNFILYHITDSIDVVLSLNFEQKFDQMRMNFGRFLKKLCESLASKPVSMADLKDQIAFSFCDLEEHIEYCSSITDVIKVLQKSNYCSFANSSIVEWLIQNFELLDLQQDWSVYCRQRDEYYKTIKLEEFVQEAHESIGRNKKVLQ